MLSKAACASEGMFGLSAMRRAAISPMLSIRIGNSTSSSAGTNSGRNSTRALLYGSLSTHSKMRNRFFPWMMIVVLPSGILKLLTICAIVPVGNTSPSPGSSVSPSFWAIIPTNFGSSVMLRIKRKLLSRPAVMGATTPGKITVFLSGRIGNNSGSCSWLISASSSEVINGINSVFSFIISLNDKLSIIFCS